MKTYRRMLCLVLAIVLMATCAISASACTTVAVGKDASDTGSVLVAHTCDGWYDHRIQIVEGGKHAAGEEVEIWNDPCTLTKNEATLTGTIPQAEETYTYFNTGYPFMNEKGVVMSEFTWSGDYNNFYSGEGMFVIANLEMLGLQRAATAREAVQVMGALAEKYGYCDGGECLLVADQNETWIFEICGPGPLWTPDSGKCPMIRSSLAPTVPVWACWTSTTPRTSWSAPTSRHGPPSWVFTPKAMSSTSPTSSTPTPTATCSMHPVVSGVRSL